MSKSVESLSGGNIRIKFTAFDSKLLDRVVAQVVIHIKRVGGVVKGPIPLPTEIDRVTVNRSPHIDKKSREQFERRKHYRLIQIVNASPDIIDQLSTIDLPAGVDAEIKVIKKAS